MNKCIVCGNNYDKTFEINYNGKQFNFDSFECAIHKLAPRCAHCGCNVIGHGVENNNQIYCCEHCVKQKGMVN